MEDWQRLYAVGDAFSNGKFDLRKLEIIISNYRQIIDHVLPITLGQRTMTERIKRKVKYEVEIKNGSLDVYLQFVIEHKEELVSLFAVDGGTTFSYFISKLLDSALNLRRVFTEFLSKGFKPKIIINKNTYNDYSLNYDLSKSKITLNNPTILLAAQNTKPPLDRIIEGIDGKDVEKININSEETETNLTADDRVITGKQTQELISDVELLGRLDMVAFSSHRGLIETSGKKYSVTWDEKLRRKIQKFVDLNNIVFKVRPIIDFRRFKDDPIGFHIIDCWELQGKLKL